MNISCSNLVLCYVVILHEYFCYLFMIRKVREINTKELQCHEH